MGWDKQQQLNWYVNIVKRNENKLQQLRALETIDCSNVPTVVHELAMIWHLWKAILCIWPVIANSQRRRRRHRRKWWWRLMTMLSHRHAHWAYKFFHAEPSNCTYDDAINSTLNDAACNNRHMCTYVRFVRIGSMLYPHSDQQRLRCVLSNEIVHKMQKQQQRTTQQQLPDDNNKQTQKNIVKSAFVRSVSLFVFGFSENGQFQLYYIPVTCYIICVSLCRLHYSVEVCWTPSAHHFCAFDCRKLKPKSRREMRQYHLHTETQRRIATSIEVTSLNRVRTKWFCRCCVLWACFFRMDCN